MVSGYGEIKFCGQSSRRRGQMNDVTIIFSSSEIPNQPQHQPNQYSRQRRQATDLRQLYYFTSLYLVERAAMLSGSRCCYRYTMSLMVLLLDLWGHFCFWHLHNSGSSSSMMVVSGFSAYSFMSDLPTPSLLLDMQALQRRVNAFTEGGVAESPIPPILLSNDQILVPTAFATTTTTQKINNHHSPHSFDPESKPLPLLDASASIHVVGTAQHHDPVCYFNARVVESRSSSRQDGESSNNIDIKDATFLAQLDLPTTTTSATTDVFPAAQLVLGLNNHHCVSYYWARSAGAGAAMEAPGVVFQQGQLRWQSVDDNNNGLVVSCNSNDGKRSEWVNFLRPGDMVQLLPCNKMNSSGDDDDDESVVVAAASVLQFVQAMGGDKQCIFGVSAKGRPLGSEPVVVCEWRIQSINPA